MGVVLISTIFFSTFGIENWKILARIWAVIPVLNGIVFLTSPIYSLHEEGEKGLSIKELCSMKIFWGNLSQTEGRNQIIQLLVSHAGGFVSCHACAEIDLGGLA